MKKNKITYLSKRLSALMIGGSMILSITGCGDKQVVEVEQINDIDKIEQVIDENQVYYNEIINLQKDIVSFGEGSLPNGFMNDEDLQRNAEVLTNAYIQINNSRISNKSIAILDQDLDLVPSKISNDFMEFSTLVARYGQISTPDTVLPYNYFIKDENDCEFITNLSTKVAEMNVCTDNESRQQKINEIIEIKESLLSNENITIDYNSETLYLATKIIEYADANAKAYGSQIITEEEEKIQLYSSFFDKYCEVSVTSGYIEEADLIELGVSSPTSFESKYLSTSSRVMESIINKVSEFRNENYDKEYSYNQVTRNIAEKLVGLYVASEQTSIERENEIRRATSDAIDARNIGTTTTREVSANEVPTNSQVPTTTTTKDETGDEISQTYLNAKSAAITDGSNAAYAEQQRTGVIPSMKTLGSEPSKKSTNYTEVYNYFYAKSWNTYVTSAINAQSKSTTETIPVENGTTEEKTVEEGTMKGSDSNTTSNVIVTEDNSTVEYIPVDGEEEEVIIEEGDLTSKINTKDYLTALKNAIISNYTFAYDNEKDDVKTM